MLYVSKTTRHFAFMLFLSFVAFGLVIRAERIARRDLRLARRAGDGQVAVDLFEPVAIAIRRRRVVDELRNLARPTRPLPDILARHLVAIERQAQAHDVHAAGVQHRCNLVEVSEQIIIGFQMSNRVDEIERKSDGPGLDVRRKRAHVGDKERRTIRQTEPIGTLRGVLDH